MGAVVENDTYLMEEEEEEEEEEVLLKDFFPATTDAFVQKAGRIKSVKASDFDNKHRRRHLESFKKSWDEWASYDPLTDKNYVTPEKAQLFVKQLVDENPSSIQEFEAVCKKLRRSLKCSISKSQMLLVYEQLIEKGLISRVTEGPLETLLIRKVVRTHSGVVVITVLTSPGSFSCPKDCHYCPNEPGQPRSYLSTEPAVLRANQNGWDAALQFWDRGTTLYRNGHTIDKIEVLVLGGTWSGYPKSYQEEFIRDLFYAANTFEEYTKVLEEADLALSISSRYSLSDEVTAASETPAPEISSNCATDANDESNSQLYNGNNNENDSGDSKNESNVSSRSVTPEMCTADRQSPEMSSTDESSVQHIQSSNPSPSSVANQCSSPPSERAFQQRIRPPSVLPGVPKCMRERLSLEEEQKLNESASCRIIGLTLETRPDHIDRAELGHLRRFGCTRVQIGIQHVDNVILKHINRGCTLDDGIKAIWMLKDAGFKVDIHVMPDLPGSDVIRDKAMFEYILSSSSMQADQWKIYPCEVTPFSRIEQWYKDGVFVPYAEQNDGRELTQLLVKVKTAVHPWIRLNRVIRDIPNQSIIAGNDKTNLRQVLLHCMSRRQLICRCLRCREVRTESYISSEGRLKVRKYPSLGGEEYFLSFETEDELKLFGFLRLRFRNCDLYPPSSDHSPPSKKDVSQNGKYKQLPSLPPLSCPSLSTYDYGPSDLISPADGVFPEIERAGMVRELHVYGQLVGHGESKSQDDSRHQHAGFGKRLLAAAEVITISKGLSRMSVIAGIGTRNYYRKFGYEVDNTYMTKPISKGSVEKWINQVKVEIPIKAQLYDTTTDLGHINTKMEIPLPHETGGTITKTDPEDIQPVVVQTKLGPRVVKKRPKKEVKQSRPDVLTPYGQNCSAEVKSKSRGEELIYLDHIDTIRSESELSGGSNVMGGVTKLITRDNIVIAATVSAAAICLFTFFKLKVK